MAKSNQNLRTVLSQDIIEKWTLKERNDRKKCEVSAYPWFAETNIANIYSVDCITQWSWEKKHKSVILSRLGVERVCFLFDRTYLRLLDQKRETSKAKEKNYWSESTKHKGPFWKMLSLIPSSSGSEAFGWWVGPSTDQNHQCASQFDELDL